MMLINLEQFNNSREKNKIKLVLTTLSILIAMGVFTLIINNNVDLLNTDNLQETTMLQLFEKLFSTYYLPFELATMLLLGSIVAVVVLTSHYKEKTEE
jgi:NADH:ubiquinone oxidoreductase subunit 6 (subunit J)